MSDAPDPDDAGNGRTPRDVLARALLDAPHLVDVALSLFEHAQFLLDDDGHLTKHGLLDGAGRAKLQARARELLGEAPAAEAGSASATNDDNAS